MIFASIIAPVLESTAETIITGLEAIKGKWSVKITEYNYQIQNIGSESTSPRVIGFAPKAEEEDYEEN